MPGVLLIRGYYDDAVDTLQWFSNSAQSCVFDRLSSGESFQSLDCKNTWIFDLYEPQIREQMSGPELTLYIL